MNAIATGKVRGPEPYPKSIEFVLSEAKFHGNHLMLPRRFTLNQKYQPDIGSGGKVTGSRKVIRIVWEPRMSVPDVGIHLVDVVDLVD